MNKYRSVQDLRDEHQRREKVRAFLERQNGVAASDDEVSRFRLQEEQPELREDEPAPATGGKVMRFDSEWEKTPEGFKLKKKNIRYEER